MFFFQNCAYLYQFWVLNPYNSPLVTHGGYSYSISGSFRNSLYLSDHVVLAKVKKHAPTIFSFKKLTASEKVHRDIHLVGHVIKPLKPDWKMTGLSFEQTGKPAPKEWFKFVPSSVKISRVIMKKSRKCKNLRITSMHRRTPCKMCLKFSLQLLARLR